MEKLTYNLRIRNSFKSYLVILIILTIIINFIGIFLPIVRNDDPILYAIISKNMVLNSNWSSLIFKGQDWLDKPHLPFWLTLLSFKIFGVKSFAYILPGFIFHLIGAYYTYNLAFSLYRNKEIGLISTLIYLSSLHLFISSIDVRAEAYLLGSIIPSCYYWYKYAQISKTSIKYLLLGTTFTAIALMTKGPFILLVSYGGIIFKFVFNKEISKLFSLKWISAFILPFIFILPEYISLYLQFDSHPEKLVHGKYGVSGIKWFLWDSQFGRFFNTGPITVNHVQPFHYFYYFHTFLWSFLPWSLIFIFICLRDLKYYEKIENKNHLLFLFGSFIPAFIVFSITKFQLDHYINILIPFSSILCAEWMYRYKKHNKNIPASILNIQIYFCYFLLILVTILSVIIFNLFTNLLILSLVVLIIYIFLRQRKKYQIDKIIVYSVLVFNLIFIFMLEVNEIYIKYDLGYQVANQLNNMNKAQLLTYKVDSLTLEFYLNSKYKTIIDIKDIYKYNSYYLLISENNLKLIQGNKYYIVKVFQETTIDKVFNNILHLSDTSKFTHKYLLIKI